MVILWHTNVINIPWLNSIWMPLFFMVSGIFFSIGNSFYSFIVKRINSILVPFLFFYIISYLIFYTCNAFFPGLIKTSAKGIGDVFFQRQYFNGPLWFLLSLFEAYLLMYGISKMRIREGGRCLIVCIFTIMGYILISSRIFIPLCIDSTLSLLPFFYLGVLIRKYSILEKIRSYGIKQMVIASVLMLFAITLLLICDFPSYNARDNYSSGNFGVSFLFICISLGWLFCILAKTNKIFFLTYFGEYSLIPLCLHHLIYRPIQLIENNITINGGVGYLTALLTIIFCTIAIPVCHRIMPYFVGKKKLF